jgi:protein-L-isoaspartate(D-aspartate) O-methyltransferase
MDALGLRNVIIRQADGSNGMPGEGTFDRILVTAAFSTMPRFYAEQLVHGGSMVAPLLQEDERCMMVRLTKTGSRFEREDLFPVPYLPLVAHMAAHL